MNKPIAKSTTNQPNISNEDVRTPSITKAADKPQNALLAISAAVKLAFFFVLLAIGIMVELCDDLAC